MKMMQTILSRVMRRTVVLAWVCLAVGQAWAAVRYVNLNNPAPAPPYGTWASAATNIQDAIDVAAGGDEIVVINGIYNRVVAAQPVTLRSVNGPEPTVIDGASAGRCVYLASGAALVGFTLTNGYARTGGGVW